MLNLPSRSGGSNEIPRPFDPQPRSFLTLSGSFDPARLEYEAGLERADRKRLVRWIVAAAAVHLVLLAVKLPDLAGEPLAAAQAPRVFVVQQLQFRPPPVRAEQEIPKPKTRKIPIPDPTPDDPEPIRLVEELDVEPELPDVDAVFFGIPDGPPGPAAVPDGILEVGGEVLAPVKVHAPQPTYTEEARAARVQGVVILRAIVDELGDVHDVRILKGLPLGMAETTVEAVSQWKFEPATRNGQPVPVFFNITVSFSLQ